MREKHEIEKGIICERCLAIVQKGYYTSIRYVRPVVEDTTGVNRTISRMNLCNECFEEYKKIIEAFTGNKYIEKENQESKVKKLKI